MNNSIKDKKHSIIPVLITYHIPEILEEFRTNGLVFLGVHLKLRKTDRLVPCFSCDLALSKCILSENRVGPVFEQNKCMIFFSNERWGVVRDHNENV